MGRIPAGLLMGIALATASCGESTTELGGDALTREEAVALIEVAMGQGFTVAGDVTGGDEVLTPEGATLQFMAPCTRGGMVAVDVEAGFVGGPGSQNPEGGGVRLEATLVHSDCTETHAGTGFVFTLDGAPDLDVTIELLYSENFAPTISGSLAGTVRWATEDGRSGSCSVDIRIEPLDDPGALLGLTISGQACSAQIMESFSATGLF